MKRRAAPEPDRAGRKPRWLRAQLPSGSRYLRLKGLMREHRLATVCEESHCPNIGECWNAGTA
ncbi:MAG: lipoyl synthase, partial [Chromatiales bacterium]|nr:lipoyl synthase [Chromatiales bacterium]